MLIRELFEMQLQEAASPELKALADKHGFKINRDLHSHRRSFMI